MYYEQFGIVCRHIYKVLGQKPKAIDAVIHWHKVYRYFYLRSEKLIAKFEEALDNEPPGPMCCLPVGSNWPVGEGDKVRSYFDETPGCALIQRNNRWYSSTPDVQWSAAIAGSQKNMAATQP